MVTRALDFPSQTREEEHTIGAILVEHGKLTPHDVDEVLRFARDKKLLFGAAAIRLKRVTRADVDTALARQFHLPIFERGEHGIADDVIAAYQPGGATIEALRALGARIRANWIDAAAGGNTIVVTSPARREGRSWVCANLAMVFAQAGDRVLIVDADLRQPSQHRLFNIENTGGLSLLLAGRNGRESIARVHPRLHLYVLTAGVLPPNPQELLSRPTFDALMAQCSQSYDIVLFDTPAATVTADAQQIAGRASAAVMLARRHHTRHASLRAAMDSLKQANVNVIGGVVLEH
jgi:chain length determinant protein tyrosine kinase EpsG